MQMRALDARNLKKKKLMKLNVDDSLFVLADVIRAIFQHFCYKNDKMWTSWVRVAYFDIFCGVTVERVLDLWALIRSL